MIINLQLRPGEIIILKQFAESLNLSRTPVKEALISLSNKGLVERASGKKFRVTEITNKSIKEIYSLREALETYTIREVINDYTANDCKEMENILKNMVDALNNKKYDLFYDFDNDFHNYYLKKYDNSMILSIMDQINEKLQRIRRFSYYTNHRLENTIHEHKLIINGFKEKDADKTILVYKAHLKNTLNALLDLLKKRKYRDGESGTSWNEFFASLKKRRGLENVDLVVPDNHKG